jgi:2-succinyl-6-hydroxy-2,4-cyclohexadiene-1-carboxylate synthase
MRVPVAGGLELAVAVHGEGPPILLIHGFGGAASAWGDAALSRLAGHRLLAVDLIGHGASDDPDGAGRVALEPVLDDLERVLDAAGVGACPWIGYSMGGRIALGGALLRTGRVSRLVLESASPGIHDERERAERRAEDERLAVSIEQGGVDAWAEGWELRPMFAARRGALTAEERERFLEARKANRAAALAAWLRGMGPGTQPSLWPRLSELSTPTLIVTGEHDAKFGALGRRMAEAIPGAEHVVIPGAGHTVHLGAPAAWGAAITSFLSR